ncbi:MAG: hypothetical protein H7257_03340 [Taibaiella sp.]|nr:hypothetical protein [Taibaiella sp.]
MKKYNDDELSSLSIHERKAGRGTQHPDIEELDNLSSGDGFQDDDYITPAPIVSYNPGIDPRVYKPTLPSVRRHFDPVDISQIKVDTTLQTIDGQWFNANFLPAGSVIEVKKAPVKLRRKDVTGDAYIVAAQALLPDGQLIDFRIEVANCRIPDNNAAADQDLLW